MNKSYLSLGAAVLIAGTALAQAPQNPATNPGSTKTAPPKYSTLDANHDGRVSKVEVKTHADLTSSFATLDADHDSYLSESEFGKWKPDGAMGSTPGATRPAPGAAMPGDGSDSGMKSPAPPSGSPQPGYGGK